MKIGLFGVSSQLKVESRDMAQRDHYVTSFEMTEYSLGYSEAKGLQWIFDGGTVLSSNLLREGTVLR